MGPDFHLIWNNRQARSSSRRLAKPAVAALFIAFLGCPAALSRDDPDRRIQPREESGRVLSAAEIAEVEQLEKFCFDEVNRRRTAAGLEALGFSEELLAVAREYSQRMADAGFFSHVDPNGRGLRERVSRAGITWKKLGENLATSKGYVNPVAVAIRGWMESPGHRGNILHAGFRKAAVGVWIARDGTIYFTEVFLG
jgi:uncharacterized protein YkwD